MNQKTPNKDAYNILPFPVNTIPYTAPNTLAARGILFGLTPPAADSCRVLDIACGRGLNLMFMAELFPNSEFVGVDLSQRHIDEASEFSEKLGFGNLSFKQMSLTELPEEMGKFDYIIVHGIYSWVSTEIQNAILSACRQHLSKQGIACIAYDIYPGCF